MGAGASSESALRAAIVTALHPPSNSQRLPSDPRRWKVGHVSLWLQKNELNALVQPFKDHGVDGQVLIEDCKDEDFESIVTFAPLRRKLKRCLDALKQQEVAGNMETAAEQISLFEIHQGLAQLSESMQILAKALKEPGKEKGDNSEDNKKKSMEERSSGGCSMSGNGAEADPNISKGSSVDVVAKDAKLGTTKEAEKGPSKEKRAADQKELQGAQETAQKELDFEASKKELDSAAAKIQAIQRGRQERQKLEELRKAAGGKDIAGVVVDSARVESWEGTGVAEAEGGTGAAEGEGAGAAQGAAVGEAHAKAAENKEQQLQQLQQSTTPSCETKMEQGLSGASVAAAHAPTPAPAAEAAEAAPVSHNAPVDTETPTAASAAAEPAAEGSKQAQDAKDAKEASKDAKETSNETRQEASNETRQEASNETRQETSNETRQETSNETSEPEEPQPVEENKADTRPATKEGVLVQQNKEGVLVQQNKASTTPAAKPDTKPDQVAKVEEKQAKQADTAAKPPEENKEENTPPAAAEGAATPAEKKKEGSTPAADGGAADAAPVTETPAVRISTPT